MRGDRLAIAIPAGGPPTWGLTKSLVGLRGPGDGGYVLKSVEGLGVVEARNLLVEQFLASDAGWLLFVDVDAVLHPLTAIRLMSWQEPIVAALAFTRMEPPHPTVYRGANAEYSGMGPLGFRIQIEETRAWIEAHPELYTNHAVVLDPRPDDALTPVDFVGMHCTLMRRDVVEAVGTGFERVHPVGGPRGPGEDYAFCRKAAAAGFGMWVDRSVQAGHLAGNSLSIGALAFVAWDRITNWDEGRFNVGQVCVSGEPGSLQGSQDLRAGR